MKRFIFSILITFLLVGCSTYKEGYFITTDDFKGQEYKHYAILDANYLTGGGVYYNFYSTFLDDKKIDSFIEVSINRNSWIFADIIIFKIDGNFFEYHELSNSRDVLGGDMIMEIVTFALDDSLFDAIQKSTIVNVRLKGKSIIDSKFEGDKLDGLKKYLKGL